MTNKTGDYYDLEFSSIYLFIGGGYRRRNFRMNMLIGLLVQKSGLYVSKEAAYKYCKQLKIICTDLRMVTSLFLNFVARNNVEAF